MRELIDLIENEDGVFRVCRERFPDCLEHAVQSLIGFLLFACDLQEDLVGGTKQRTALLEVDILDSHCIGAGCELTTDPSRGHRLSSTWRAINRHRCREVFLVNAVENRG